MDKAEKLKNKSSEGMSLKKLKNFWKSKSSISQEIESKKVKLPPVPSTQKIISSSTFANTEKNESSKKGIYELDVDKLDSSLTKIPVNLINFFKGSVDINFSDTYIDKFYKDLKSSKYQPVVVAKVNDGYALISGEKYFLAAKKYNLQYLNCIIKNSSISEAKLQAIVENKHRKNLLPIEEAELLKNIMDSDKSLSLEKISKKIGSHKSTVSEKIKLTNAPIEIKQALFLLENSYITHRHWRVLSRIKNIEKLKEIFNLAITKRYSVAVLERTLQSYGVKKVNSKSINCNQDWIGCSNGIYSFKSVSFDPKNLTPESKKHCLEIILQLKKDLTMT